jgi:hypothetical protein
MIEKGKNLVSDKKQEIANYLESKIELPLLQKHSNKVDMN